MRIRRGLGIVAAAWVLSGAVGGLMTSSVQAVQLSDGRVYFIQPPRLGRVTTTERTALASTAVYYFTIAIPADAGEPLQRVTVVQRDGDSSNRRILVNPRNVRAFAGDGEDRGTPLPLNDVTFDRDTQTVTLNFDPPIQPGTTVTIGIRPERNPYVGGVYLYGVTAFPAGATPYGQFLGYGRIDIDDRGDGFQMF